MSEITVIGLGAMGSALTRTLLNAGHAVTVWNRSPQNIEPFVKLGATASETIVEAVQASPHIIVCISDYPATKELFRQHDVTSHLAGRTVIQLSTGSPKEAREAEAWLVSCGVDYLDGAILCYPSVVGTKEAQILFAGPGAVFERCKPFVQCLGGDLRYLGDNIGAAATLDIAMNCYELSAYLGVIHGALVCEAEDLGVSNFASLFRDDDIAAKLARTIHAGAYDDAGATIRVWSAAMRHIQAHAVDAGVNCEIPDFISSLCKRAIAAGHGEEDFAALIKVLQTRHDD